MDKNQEQQLIEKPINSIKSNGDELIDKILVEEDQNELDKLTQLFNMNQKKREIARVNSLSNLLETIDGKVRDRVEKYADVMEDKDLISYWKITQDNVYNRSDEDNQLPKITINNTQNINVNSSGLNRESREKVLDIVNQILKESQEDVIDVEVKKEDR